MSINPALQSSLPHIERLYMTSSDPKVVYEAQKKIELKLLVGNSKDFFVTILNNNIAGVSHVGGTIDGMPNKYTMTEAEMAKFINERMSVTHQSEFEVSITTEHRALNLSFPTIRRATERIDWEKTVAKLNALGKLKIRMHHSDSDYTDSSDEKEIFAIDGRNFDVRVSELYFEPYDEARCKVVNECREQIKRVYLDAVKGNQ